MWVILSSRNREGWHIKQFLIPVHPQLVIQPCREPSTSDACRLNMFLSSGDRGQSTGYTLSRRSKNTHCFIIDCNPQFWSANPCFVEIIDSILMFSRSLSISGDIPLIFMLTSPISTLVYCDVIYLLESLFFKVIPQISQRMP